MTTTFDGRFKPGNQIWRQRSKHGRDKIFATPEQLWEACVEYFDWVEANPLFEVKSYLHNGCPVQDQIPKMRAMTIGGLCLFLDIDHETWKDYCRRSEFIGICARAERAIREQKFSGAAAGLLNHAIIARDLGLADKVDHGGQADNPIKTDTTYRIEFVNAPVAQPAEPKP